MRVALVWLALIVTAQFIPPGDAWLECCSERDCEETQVEVLVHYADMSEIKVTGFDLFLLDRANVHTSLNSKEYLCRYNLDKPPSYENTRCVFVTQSLTHKEGHT